MPAIETHPSAEALSAFTLGQLLDDQFAEVEAHLAACPECQSKAAHAPDDSLVSLLRAVHASSIHRSDTLRESVTLPPAAVLSDVTASPVTATFPVAFVGDAPEALARHERYRVVRLLGQGGMGAVYEAEHRAMQRPVALKVINSAFISSPAAVERFRREVRAASKLSHPNVVTAFDAETAGETHFLVMEYVAGSPLSRLVKEGGPLPVAEACDYVRQAALGLQHAHERGMVHRDVKPDNLILTEDGCVKVLDFGLAVLNAERRDGLTETNMVMGTPEYLAPEQAEDARSADGRADVYGLGCTLFYLLTGKVPYPAETALLKILAHRERPVPMVPGASAELSGVLAKMMAKRPADRYQSAAEVAQALAAFTTPERKKPRRGRGWLVAAGLLFCAVAAVAGVVVHHIKTDNGVLEITTESDDVEVIVKQGGKVVRIVDTKTNKSITLRSGVYELETKEGEGLRLDLDKVSLKRGEKVLARVVRPEKTVGGGIDLLQRVAIPGPRAVYQTAVSSEGKYFAAAVDGNGVLVWDGTTGKELRRLEGYLVQFAHATDRLVTGDKRRLIVHDLAGEKQLATLALPAGLWGFSVLGNGRHVVVVTHNKQLHLADLDDGKVLRSWTYSAIPSWAATDDGKFLFVKFDNEKEYQAFDVTANKASDAFASLRKYSRIHSFRPGSKQAVAIEGGKLHLVDVADGKKVAELTSTPGRAMSASRNADLTRTAIEAYNDGKLKVYDMLAGKGKERATFHFPDGEKPKNDNTIWLTPDGRFVCVSTDRSVYLLRLPPVPVAPKNAKQ